MATQPAKKALNTAPVPPVAAASSRDSTSERIASTHTEELVIALCGPIGSPLHSVAEEIQRMIRDTFGYDKAEIIRLSDFIGEHAAKGLC